jgi:hypothetical protein
VHQQFDGETLFTFHVIVQRELIEEERGEGINQNVLIPVRRFSRRNRFCLTQLLVFIHAKAATEIA